MSAVKQMSKASKKHAAEVASAARGAFWNGVLEGFSGPLMMGTPVVGCLNQFRSEPKNPAIRDISVRLNGGMIVIETASLTKSSKEIAAALQHATQGVMRARKLVYRVLNDRTVGRDGKFHQVPRVTIEPADPADEPRKQP